MKKSTILLVSLVYILSFLIVGLFGISVKGYNNKVYVDSIQIKDYDNGNTGLKQKPADNSICDYYFACVYTTDLTVRVEARVLPDNTSFKAVNYIWEEDSPVYDLTVDGTIAIIHFKQDGSALFTAESTDGEKVQSRVLILSLDI